MSRAAVDIFASLGPTTERRFAEAFATAAVISTKAAAALIGLDEKTLAALSDAKIIRAVPKGAHRAYTERDLRAYLVEERDIECKPEKATASRPAGGPRKVVSFSEIQAKKGR